MAATTNVVFTTRIGNNTDGSTLPMTGRWAGQVVAIDGYDVLAIPVAGRSPAIPDVGYRKIFDVRAQGPLPGSPRGIVHVPTQGRLYFSPVGPGLSGDQFYVTNELGKPLPPLVISRTTATPMPDAYEGMTWIPASAPAHANTIAALGFDGDTFAMVVDFIRLDGTVEARVIPEPGTVLEQYLTGIAFRAPDELLVAATDQGTFRMNLDGELRQPSPLTCIQPGVKAFRTPW